jgi:serine/threonine-protein phosphatase 4 catalytic subunit
MMPNLKLMPGLLALAGAHLSLRNCLGYSSYTSINDRLANIQIGSLVHETGVVGKALRCYSEDLDTNPNHARIARYLLANKDNKFFMFLKALEKKDGIKLLAYMVIASLGIDGYELEDEDRRFTIKPSKAGEELNIQLCEAFNTEETKLADDVLWFFFGKGPEAKERMQMGEYIQTKNFLLHAFMGEYLENSFDAIRSIDRIIWSLLVELGGYYEHKDCDSSLGGILRDILAHVDKQEKSLSSHKNLRSLKNYINHNLSSSVVIQQLYGSYGRQALPALFKEYSLYDYENKDILSILLLDKLETDEHRLEALDLMFPESACKGEILEQMVGYKDDKSVGDPIEYLYKKGSETTELAPEMGMFLFEKGLVNMFLHWSRTGDVQSIKDVDDEIAFRNYVRMAKWSDPREIYDLVEKVGYDEGRKQEILLCLISECPDHLPPNLLVDDILTSCYESAKAYNGRNYEEALKCIKEAAGRSEWCMSRLCMIYLRLGRYYEFRECNNKLRNKRINARLSKMVEKLPTTEDEPKTDFNSILDQVNGTIPAERVRRICDMAVKVLTNSDNVVHVRGKDVMVVGDTIWGKPDDVVKLVKENWKKGWIFVFNGNLESFWFLLLLKTNFPGRVFLNRGRKESSYTNDLDHMCIPAWLVDVYAALPLATIINKEVFVVHGGLHYEPVSIEGDIQPVERNVILYDGMIFSNLFWARPSDVTRFSKYMKREAFMGRGEWFRFGPEITGAFLRNNNMGLVVRSHEYKYEYTLGGYRTDHGGKTVTVHSATWYRMCGEYARGHYLLFYYTGEEGLEEATKNEIIYSTTDHGELVRWATGRKIVYSVGGGERLIRVRHGDITYFVGEMALYYVLRRQ